MKQLLFGYHPDWLVAIGARLDRARYQPSFAPLDAVDLGRFDAVLPLQLAHYRELKAHGAHDGRKFIVPDPETVDLCDDKLTLARFLVEQGFGRFVPEIIGDAPLYPRIRKPRRGEHGAGCRVIAGLESDSSGPPPGWFDQAAVPGTTEYALHVLRADGRVRYHQGVRYEMGGRLEIRSAANQPVRASLVDGEQAARAFEPILAALGYTGTCCINFKLLDGRPMILEINPRFGGSLIYDISRYADAYCEALAR